jgi:hypothetical protein
VFGLLDVGAIGSSAELILSIIVGLSAGVLSAFASVMEVETRLRLSILNRKWLSSGNSCRFLHYS